MARVKEVLVDSFRLLVERPVLFLPKLFSTAVGALWLLGIVSGTGPLYLYAVTGPLIVLLGVAVSVLLAAMVEHKDSGTPLRSGLSELGGRSFELLASTLLFMLVGLVLYLPFAAGAAVYLLYGVRMALYLGVLLSILLLLGFSFLAFFFPIGLVRKDSVLEGFSESARTSVGNSREVLSLTVFSFLLLGAASFTGNQGLEFFGYAGFLVLRVASGVVTTYIFVVSPEYYLRN